SLLPRVVLPGKARVDPRTLGEDTLDLPLVEVAPRTKYKVVVKAGVTAVDGERLARDLGFAFEGADLSPRVSWSAARDAGGEAARGDLSFLVGARNLPSYEAVRAPIGEEALATLLFEPPSFARIRAMPESVATTTPASAAPNAWSWARVAVPAPVRAKG